MSAPAGFKGLRFPCECVSSMPGGYSDPWAEITKKLVSVSHHNC